MNVRHPTQIGNVMEAIHALTEESYGFITILEVEDSKVSMDAPGMYNGIVHALEDLGIAILSTSSFQTEILFMALQEGYITIRCWPEYRYFAFDLMLWSSFEKQESIEATLVAIVGGKSSSSYHIVTSGMFRTHSDETVASKIIPEKHSDNEQNTPPQLSATNDILDLDVLLKVLTTLRQNHTVSVTIVICADKGNDCMSLDALRKDDGLNRTILTIWACGDKHMPWSQEVCDKTTRNILDSTIPLGKIDTIIFDPTAPRHMGQVLYNILKDGSIRRKLLAKQYIVLAPLFEPSESWAKALMERFRTEIVRFSPAHHAEIVISKASSLNKTRFREVHLFSSGDPDFYVHLSDAMVRFESRSELLFHVQNIKDGIINYIADHEPTRFVTDADYDNTLAREQWIEQHPVGLQIISQFEILSSKLSLSPGDQIFVNVNEYTYFTEPWYSAEVLVKNDDGTYDVIYKDGSKTRGVERRWILKPDNRTELSTSEKVLVRQDGGEWYEGKLFEKMTDGTYKVHLYDGGGSIIFVAKSDLVKHTESVDMTELPEFPSFSLKTILRKAITASSDNMTGEEVFQIHDGAGEGQLVTAFWPNGSAIATWDGRTHIDLNVFTFEEDKQRYEHFERILIEDIPSLALISLNEQPRGFGRVVSFNRDIQLWKEGLLPTRFR